MLQEFDIVHLKSGSAAVPLPAGTKGAILMVFPDTPPAYEVEFVDETGLSLGTFTVRESELAARERARHNSAA